MNVISDLSAQFYIKEFIKILNHLPHVCVLRKINKKIVNMLKLKKTEKLTFVYQIVYNTDSVEFFGKVGEDGSVSAAFKTFFKFHVSVSFTNKDLNYRQMNLIQCKAFKVHVSKT